MNIKTFVIVISLIFPAYANAGLADIILPAIAGPVSLESGSDNTAHSDSTPVVEVLKMWDDAHVVVDGYIVERNDNKGYTFYDDSGSIPVTLDHDDVAQLNISPEDKVRIFGRVDHGFTKASIENARIERIQ